MSVPALNSAGIVVGIVVGDSAVITDMMWHGETDRRKKTTTSVLFLRDTAVSFGKEAEDKWESMHQKDSEPLAEYM
jgi:hypothetical protein